MGRPGVLIFFDDVRPALSNLDDAELGRLFKAVLEYSEFAVLPDGLSPVGKLVFDMLQPHLDRDGVRYEGTIMQKRYAAFCREYKRQNPGQEPPSFDEWKKHRPTSTDNEPTSTDNARYPTTSPATSSTTSSIPSTISAASTGESAPRGVEQHTQFSDSLSEMEFENKRQRQLESLRSILS